MSTGWSIYGFRDEAGAPATVALARADGKPIEREHMDQLRALLAGDLPPEPLIGPLTAAEWCAFRQTGDDDDLLQCCAITSDFRDALFAVLRMGADKYLSAYLREEWAAMEAHGWPAGVPQIRRIGEFYGLVGTPADAEGGAVS